MSQLVDSFAAIPPQNLEAEEAILGACFIDNDSIHRVAEHLKPSDFYGPSHQKIFGAMLELANRGEPIDIIAIAHSLNRELDSIGGASRLTAIFENAFTSANVLHHVELVREAARKRALLESLRQAEAEIAESSDDCATIASRLSTALIEQESGRPGGFVHIGAVMIEAVKRIEAAHDKGSTVSGIPTGFRELDSRVGGIHPGELWVPAGRPGMGKSAFAVDIAKGAAKRGYGVCFVSLEMENPRVGQRLLSSATKIENRNLRRGLLSDRDFPVITAASGDIGRLPLWLLDSDRQWDRIKSKIRSLKLREPNLSLAVIDYVGLISAPVRNGARYLEVGRISAEAKRLAIELHIGVVLVSQLNRDVEDRTDKRPQLSDLRESGSLEQDADVVCFLYRDAYYNRESSFHDLAELNVAKNRDGVRGMLKLRFTEETVSFSDWCE